MFLPVRATRSSYLRSLGHTSERCDANVVMRSEASIVQISNKNRWKGQERRSEVLLERLICIQGVRNPAKEASITTISN
eukprot:scaffold391_cov412-Pavlova_lutheri.AAC.10